MFWASELASDGIRCASPLPYTRFAGFRTEATPAPRAADASPTRASDPASAHRVSESARVREGEAASPRAALTSGFDASRELEDGLWKG
jgi:hypothetical protein